MKKVLLLTNVNFWEKTSGHRVRISALIEYLANKVELTVVNTGPVGKNIDMTIGRKLNFEFYILEKKSINTWWVWASPEIFINQSEF